MTYGGLRREIQISINTLADEVRSLDERRTNLDNEITIKREEASTIKEWANAQILEVEENLTRIVEQAKQMIRQAEEKFEKSKKSAEIVADSAERDVMELATSASTMKSELQVKLAEISQLRNMLKEFNERELKKDIDWFSEMRSDSRSDK